MANNYTLFSTDIAFHLEEEKAEREGKWLRHQLQMIKVRGDVETEFDSFAGMDLDDEEDLSTYDYVGCRFLRDMPGVGDGRNYPVEAGFEYDVDDGFWAYSEDNGNAENLAWLMQKFLKEFDPNGWYMFTIAQTCSLPRVGEFTGAGYLITASDIHVIDVEHALGELAKKLGIDKTDAETAQKDDTYAKQ